MGTIDYVYKARDAAWYAAYAPILWCSCFAWIIYVTHVGYRSKCCKSHRKLEFARCGTSSRFRLRGDHTVASRSQVVDQNLVHGLPHAVPDIFLQRGHDETLRRLRHHQETRKVTCEGRTTLNGCVSVEFPGVLLDRCVFHSADVGFRNAVAKREGYNI